LGGIGTTLYDAIMEDTYHNASVQTHRISNTKPEPNVDCEMRDVSM
jgi:hypothetical protein